MADGAPECPRTVSMKRKIVGFHQDEHGDWIADLECGHTQHVRHNPPWLVREWVMTAEGRAGFIGRELECRACEEGQPDAV